MHCVFIFLNYHLKSLILAGTYFLFLMVFVGSGSSPTFDKDPDQEKLYYSLPYNLRNVTASNYRQGF